MIGAQQPGTCKSIAAALRPYLNPKNLFVISTDFSHYPGYDDAVQVDKASADAILSNSVSRLIDVRRAAEERGIPNLLTTMCGWSCVLTLLYMTEGSPEFEYTHIQYKNSGDSEAGDRKRVVGYNAIAVSLKEEKESPNIGLTEAAKKDLLVIARNAIDLFVRNGRMPVIDTSRLDRGAKRKGGAFVTLRKQGELRGCIGRFDASEPLYDVVQQMAVASATEDYRFSRVQPDEMAGIDVEISALTPMRKISSIGEITLGRDGIYIRKGDRSGTFLPQVADETGWTKEEFLGHCARDKAGLAWDGWKGADIYVFQATVFGEKDFSK